MGRTNPLIKIMVLLILILINSIFKNLSAQVHSSGGRVKQYELSIQTSVKTTAYKVL